MLIVNRRLADNAPDSRARLELSIHRLDPCKPEKPTPSCAERKAVLVLSYQEDGARL